VDIAHHILNLKVVVGLALLLVTLFRWPHLLAIDTDFVKWFTKVALCFGVPMRCLLLWSGHDGKMTFALEYLLSLPMSALLGVGWEDGFFVLPLLLLRHFRNLHLAAGNLKRAAALKAMVTVATPVLAILFTAGHAYQGWVGLLTIMYWLFSYQIGRKHGLGTSMLCHIVLDVVGVTVLHLYSILFLGGL
jgi:hypothetical protein